MLPFATGWLGWSPKYSQLLNIKDIRNLLAYNIIIQLPAAILNMNQSQWQ
jgi:hypothetical protein